MHAFALAVGVGDAGDRLVHELLAFGDEFGLDRGTHWQVQSRSREMIATGMHHAPSAVGRRRYVAVGDDRVTLFDGLPVHAGDRFEAHDAEHLDTNWRVLPDALEGQFCAIRIYLDRDEAEVLTDPLGILPVFHARRGQGFVASNSASVVASVLRCDDPDPIAVSSFVALGWATERRTFFSGITALAGGSVHRLASHSDQSEPYFGPATVADAMTTRRSGPTSADRAPESLANELVNLSAAATRAGGPVRCALTAGRDTRVMAALLGAADIPVRFYTQGESFSDDVRIACELAQRFGFTHEVLPEGGSARDWTSAAARFVHRNDGLSSLVQLVDYVELEKPIDELEIIFWGVGGEIGRAGSGTLSNVSPNLPFLSRLRPVQRRLLMLKVDDQGLLTESGRKLVHDFLRRFVDARLHERWPARELSEAFYAFERVVSWGAAAPRRAADRGDLFSPYCTRPFINYCFSLTASERYIEAPHYRLLRVLSPELLEHRFGSPFRAQRPALAGPLAARQLWRAIRLGQRHGAGPSDGQPGPPFLQRWLQDNASLLQTLAERTPTPIWEVVDRSRFAQLLTEGDQQLAEHRDTLLRIASPLWILATRADLPA